MYKQKKNYLVRQDGGGDNNTAMWAAVAGLAVVAGVTGLEYAYQKSVYQSNFIKNIEQRIYQLAQKNNGVDLDRLVRDIKRNKKFVQAAIAVIKQIFAINNSYNQLYYETHQLKPLYDRLMATDYNTIVYRNLHSYFSFNIRPLPRQMYRP
jgi:hypothetical protein